jgi:ABC-type dipeptide/oligopeptide/nickel transport system permease subunit
MAVYQEKSRKSKRQKVFHVFRLIFGFGIAGILFILFMLSTFNKTPHNPESPDDFLTAKPYQPPFQSAKYPLGTDYMGRDILSRLIAGAEPYFLPGLTAVVISLGLGLLLGTVSGFYGGRKKSRINIFVSVINSFPRLVLFLLFMAILKIDIWVIMVLLGLFNAPKVATLVEGKVHALKRTDFIEAARALGLRDRKIIWYHIILKNCLALLLVQATYGFADAILVETTLSYLGFGVPEPHASWGNMVLAGTPVFSPAPGQPFFEGKFWVSSIPAVMIMIAILGLHQAGDNLNRILEEK